ncbi:thiol reductant ABC exporter subunit CydD [Actinoplanes sp. NPDC049802]|uniref:thiol reductant ABC exporter subunit CydD n=1 Tax=Actinoplanes sp. NPDC049802 TaxID=3154742 RepID=UPI0034081CA5
MKPLDPRLLRYARATRAYLAATVLLGAVHAVLLVAQAVLLAETIAAVFLDGAAVTTVAALVAIFAARAAVAWLQEVAAARSAAAVKSQLRRRLLAHLAALGPGRSRPAGEVAALAGNGLDALDAYFARYLPQLVLAVLVPGILLLRLLPADLVATVTIVVTLPLIPLFMALVGMHTEAQNRRQFRLLARLSHHFLDVVAGLPTLKLLGRARAQAAIIRRISDEQRRHTMRTLRTAFLSSLVLELLATLSVALVAVGIGLRLVSGDLDLATALLVLILAPEAYRPLREVGANYHASAEGLAAAEEVFAVLETPLPPAGTLPPPDGDIVFSGVEVRYPGRAEPALRLDATVRPGEVVALTGPSGCGKSTALAVLLGFATPASGQVTVGGVPLADVDPAAWRRRIAWVPQRPHLTAASVYENIALASAATVPAGPAPHCPTRQALDSAGGPLPGWAEVIAAAQRAGVDEFARELPEGYGTMLGDAGTGLSAGQRQRIALARAFLRDAPIVLLDEPTANLDAANAAAVMTAIRRLAEGRTVIMAAHRPELIALADREISLSPGAAVMTSATEGGTA